MTVHVQCSHFIISLFQILFSFQTERVVTQEDAQWPWSDLGKEDGNTHPHSSESVSLPASLLRLRGGHNPVWSHQENLLSLTGKYKKSIIPHWLVQKIYYLSLVNQKICYLSLISTKNMLPLTGKSKILLTLASKYINIFYLSLISIKKTVISFWEVPKNLFVLTGMYEKKMLTLLVSTPPKNL